MKALSVPPLAALLIAISAKRIDTHRWSTDHRGALAIHAKQELTPAAKRLCRQEPYRSVLNAAGVTRFAQIPRGGVVCVVDVLEERPTDKLLPLLTVLGAPHEARFGSFSSGRVGLVFDLLVRLDRVIPVRGDTGIWDLPHVISAQLLSQLSAKRREKAGVR